jgi:hypothetical protein
MLGKHVYSWRCEQEGNAQVRKTQVRNERLKLTGAINLDVVMLRHCLLLRIK